MKTKYILIYMAFCTVLLLPGIGLSYTAIEYFNQGNIHFNQRRFNDAIHSFSKAIELNPTFYGAYYNLGNIYEIQKKHRKAIDNYNKAIEFYPDYFQAYNNRGAAYKSLGKYTEALKDFNKALLLKPDLYHAFKNRGALYRIQGEYNLAINDFNKAIEFKPNFFQAYFNRGLTYKLQGKYDLAIKDFDITIKFRPKHIPAHIELGYIYATSKDKSIRDGEKAVDLLLKAATIRETVAVMNALAAAYVETGQYEKAIVTYKNNSRKGENIVKEYQQSLNEKGYYSGLIDGIYSDEYDKALQAFVMDGNYL